MSSGIHDWAITDAPVAVIDFETTGLSPANDRVVEASVVRIEPGGEPELVVDTLVNPRREVAATHIHRLTDADVADAPEFPEIADAVIEAISGCVVTAFNVYFDMRFLRAELDRAGYASRPPTSA